MYFWMTPFMESSHMFHSMKIVHMWSLAHIKSRQGRKCLWCLEMELKFTSSKINETLQIFQVFRWKKPFRFLWVFCKFRFTLLAYKIFLQEVIQLLSWIGAKLSCPNTWKSCSLKSLGHLCIKDSIINDSSHVSLQVFLVEIFMSVMRMVNIVLS